MTHKSRPKPVVLCVLDGWGNAEPGETNAISRARKPVWEALGRDCPQAQLDASEDHVGLPRGQMGNSEVGHMNLGAGRVVMQELPRIDAAVADGSLATNMAFHAFVTALQKSGGAAHLIGLVSPGGVHSHQSHIAAVARHLAEAGVDVRVHALLDGRDTPPSSALDYLESFIADSRSARIATVCGRYYAMDRDKRWDRVSRAYSALVEAKGIHADDVLAAVRASYAAGVTDEFVEPVIIGEYDGMKDGDGILMANFRADRAREILTALLDPSFDGFPRERRVSFAASLGMVEYSDALRPLIPALFPPTRLDAVFGEVIAQAGLKQLRIAETEKYAHVTFFFNGGEETVFPGEERILVPSPRVATYDLQPEMSAPEVTDKLVEAIGSGRFDFILANYANTDMVGHTGKVDAAIKAVETVDSCLGRVREAVEAAGGVMLITADHGNVEMMTDPESGEPHTAHTRNLVPAILVGDTKGVAGLRDGCLADVAPTLLHLMHIPQPSAMTGHSLIIEAEARRAAI